jgi:hypothetical protein
LADSWQDPYIRIRDTDDDDDDDDDDVDDSNITAASKCIFLAVDINYVGSSHIKQ